jgi:hypothetical protein
MHRGEERSFGRLRGSRRLAATRLGLARSKTNVPFLNVYAPRDRRGVRIMAVRLRGRWHEPLSQKLRLSGNASVMSIASRSATSSSRVIDALLRSLRRDQAAGDRDPAGSAQHGDEQHLFLGRRHSRVKAGDALERPADDLHSRALLEHAPRV